MQCARHPKVETALTCTRCGTAICPSCMVSGAVGFLCPGCVKAGTSPLYKVHPARFALALVAGIAAGTIVGVVLQHISFYIFFVSAAIGGVLGEIILRATGRKIGPSVEVLTVVSIIVGAGLSLLITGPGVLFEPTSLIFFAVSVALVTVAALSKIRYF